MTRKKCVKTTNTGRINSFWSAPSSGSLEKLRNTGQRQNKRIQNGSTIMVLAWIKSPMGHIWPPRPLFCPRSFVNKNVFFFFVLLCDCNGVDDWPRPPPSPWLLFPWPVEHPWLHRGQWSPGGLRLLVSPALRSRCSLVLLAGISSVADSLSLSVLCFFHFSLLFLCALPAEASWGNLLCACLSLFVLPPVRLPVSFLSFSLLFKESVRLTILKCLNKCHICLFALLIVISSVSDHRLWHLLCFICLAWVQLPALYLSARICCVWAGRRMKQSRAEP